MPSPLVSLDRIGKSYPGVRALDDVGLDVRAGECHAVVGENGAGKSTLLKILGGVVPWPGYEGDLRIDGVVRRFGGVRDAEAAGIAVVHQELSLVGPLTAAENIGLGQEPRRWGVVDAAAMRARANALLESLHVAIEADTPVERLGVGHQQFVEIAKALGRDARVLVLDEPTAALTEGDADVLLERLGRLRARGLAIVYVSHRLGEVLRVADRVTVLRDGRSVATGPAAAFDERSLVAAMVGRTVETLFPPAGRTPGPAALSVRGLSVDDPSIPGRRLLDDISFEVREGEVLGIAGPDGRRPHDAPVVPLRGAARAAARRDARGGCRRPARVAPRRHPPRSRAADRGPQAARAARRRAARRERDARVAARRSRDGRSCAPRRSAPPRAVPSASSRSAPRRRTWPWARSRAATSRRCSSPAGC